MFRCNKCKEDFPVVSGVPVMINESHSIFRKSDFTGGLETTVRKRTNLTNVLNKFIPSLNNNVTAARNIDQFRRLVSSLSNKPRVLVVGCRELGVGMEQLVNDDMELCNTDVTLSDACMYIVDAHDIPFTDGTFDGVIVQTVLEHVADPKRCVDEIHRVLRDKGIVFAETSFNQQVHMGAYDFSRFTFMGHRRLFGAFEEIETGIGSGPGMALAWAYQYFLLSFSSSPRVRLLLKGFSRLTAFWLKYFDYLLIDSDMAKDGAATCYFIGRKATERIPDREIVGLYRGGF